MESCGIILSGGKSTRMGETKSLLPLHSKPVIEHIAKELHLCSDEVVVITNEPSKYTFLGYRLFEDRYTDKGPLAGLETALYNTNADVYLFAACDMPFIDQRIYKYLVSNLLNYDAVVPVYENRIHPLVGIYKKRILPKVQQQLENDERKVRGLFEHIKVNYISDFGTFPDELLKRHFFNMNDRKQYDQAKLL